MRIAILHNEVDASQRLDQADVLKQVEAVSDALHTLGHEPINIACSLDLSELRRKLVFEKPDRVFNIVESLDGADRLLSLVPTLLDVLGIPYTGSSAQALFMTSDKLLAKQMMRLGNLPIPPWINLENGEPKVNGDLDFKRPIIIKSIWEHASVGIDEDDLVNELTLREVAEILAERGPAMGNGCFAESFVNGREFNLSIITGPNGPQLLPHAEIEFSDYPEDKVRIVGYRAKWEEDSFEYNHTPRRFDFPDEDRVLLEELGNLALSCWRFFKLKGWARVDFRVDEANRPFILEVNTNPCLSPDAGFAAAMVRADLNFAEGISRILEDVNASYERPFW